MLLKSRKLKMKICKIIIEKVLTGRDLQKTEISYHQAPSCII